MPKKPIRFGLKYYCMNDDRKYLYYFQLHETEFAEQGLVKKSRTLVLIKDCLKNLPNKGQYIIYCDSYYTTKLLANYLSKQGYGFALAMNARRDTDWRKLKQKLKNKVRMTVRKITKNYTMALFQDLTKKKKVKHIRILTNLGDDSNRYYLKRTWNGVKEIPFEVKAYSEGMSFVDQMNQRLVLYQARSRNWTWKRVAFLSIIRFVMYNTFVVAKEHLEQKLSWCDFLTLLRDQQIKYTNIKSKQIKLQRRRESNKRTKRRQRAAEKEKKARQKANKNKNRITSNRKIGVKAHKGKPIRKPITTRRYLRELVAAFAFTD